jgi:hypothetical protein
VRRFERWHFFFLAGVSLALSELCQDGRFGGGRIPLSAILDLSTPPIKFYMVPWPMIFFAFCTVRQHQSAFVPLGPHVEKDVPKRLVQLVRKVNPLIVFLPKGTQANENVVFFDPFEEYVIVPEATRQKWVIGFFCTFFDTHTIFLLFCVICYSRYDSRRQALLVEGVDPADLSVFGVALTRGLSPSKRVTKAAVAVRFLNRTSNF